MDGSFEEHKSLRTWSRWLSSGFDVRESHEALGPDVEDWVSTLAQLVEHGDSSRWPSVAIRNELYVEDDPQ
jgi:hypothetical protein